MKTVRTFRRGVLMCGTVAGLLLAPALVHPARAQIVCANCSTFVQQLIAYAEQLAQYSKQLDQYNLQLTQYQNMVQNTNPLPQTAWANVTADIMQLNGIVNSAQMLNGQTGAVMARLANLNAYNSQFTTLPQVAAQYQTWGAAYKNDIANVMSTLDLNNSQQTSDAALLATLQQHSASADGQMRAIQAGNEMAALAASLLQKNQTVMNHYLAVSTDQIAIAADRQALADQNLYTFLCPPPPPNTGNPVY